MAAIGKNILFACLSAYFFNALGQETIGSVPPVTDFDSVSRVKTQGKLNLRNKIRPEGKGWFLYTAGSYGIEFMGTNKFSPFKEIGNKDWYQNNDDLSVKALYGTLGGGWAANFGWGHMFNKFIGIDVLHTIAWHPRKLDARINTTVDLGGGRTAAYFAEEHTKIFAIYLNPNLVMHWDNGKRFGMTGKAGLCIPIGGSPITEAHVIDHSGRILETLTGLPILPVTMLADFECEYIAKAKTTLNPTIGTNASLSFDVRLFKDTWMFAEVRVQAFTIRLKESNMQEFSLRTESPLLPLLSLLTPLPLNIANVDEAPEFFKKIVYHKEITEESNTMRYTGSDGQIKQIDIDKPMDEPGAKFNASSMYFSLGFRMNLTDRWENKRRDKVMGKRDEKFGKKDLNNSAKD